MITTMDEKGGLALPPEYLKQLGLKPGDKVSVWLENNEIRIGSTNEAVKRAQELIRRYVPEGRNLSEELIKERREEMDCE
jgi:antitoxin component of MazEF toxin-antitoxin module